MIFLARMTYNYNNNWEKPSGPNYKSTDNDQAFEAKFKFGFEEWFRCKRHEINGLQYAYIESLESYHCESKIILHTIRHNGKNKKSDRKLVGVLYKSEYYTDWNDITLDALSNALYGEMKTELKDALKILPIYEQQLAINQLNIHKNSISGKDKPLFNVRFKKEDFNYIFSKKIDSTLITKNNRFGIEKIDDEILERYPYSIQEILLSVR
ncbi:hypothetical protein [Larkinella punicea]|uniref:Uncharacterized protein n=1 Tax=Larkinella punicea TaxID=2315727 RepID=A0A368JUB6_9BACT|nr:hypothetical protein [Larkinella punicea]RCR71248.1 hypothetical protein DUE52_03085 [Larkinella punicea]